MLFVTRAKAWLGAPSKARHSRDSAHLCRSRSTGPECINGLMKRGSSTAEQIHTFGVLTWEPFRSENLTAELRREFFSSGEHYIQALFSVIDRQLEPNFRPSRALDFGCGVGRLLIPLAERCDSVVGVDVSSSMLETARQNAHDRGLSNIELVRSDDQLWAATGRFDLDHPPLIHTFQHIPTTRGVRIFERLVGS